MHQYIASHRQNEHNTAPGQHECPHTSRHQGHTLVARHQAQYLTRHHANVHRHKWHQGHDVEIQHDTAPDQVEGIAQGEQRSHQISMVALAVAQTDDEVDERSSYPTY